MNEFKPALYDEGVLYAGRALFEGVANEGQQKRFMEWLLLNVCHIGRPSIHTDPTVMAFLEGQRSVGIQLADLRKPEALEVIKAKRGKRQTND